MESQDNSQRFFFRIVQIRSLVIDFAHSGYECTSIRQTVLQACSTIVLVKMLPRLNEIHADFLPCHQELNLAFIFTQHHVFMPQ
jgi:hypothetical protein